MFQYNAVHDPKAFVFDLEGLYFLSQGKTRLGWGYTAVFIATNTDSFAAVKEKK